MSDIRDTAKDGSSAARILMAAQIAAEMQYHRNGVTPPANGVGEAVVTPFDAWRTTDPPTYGSYLTKIVNGDGVRYCAVHYWHGEWRSISQVWESVEGWMPLPAV